MAGDEHLLDVDDLIADSSLGAEGMADLCARTPDDLEAAVRSRLSRSQVAKRRRPGAAASTGRAILGAADTASTMLRTLPRRIRESRDRRFLRQIQRRAEWIEQARNASVIQPVEDAER